MWDRCITHRPTLLQTDMISISAEDVTQWAHFCFCKLVVFNFQMKLVLWKKENIVRKCEKCFIIVPESTATSSIWTLADRIIFRIASTILLTLAMAFIHHKKINHLQSDT